MEEVDKYQKMWNRPEYRNVAPGENVADLFLELAKPKRPIPSPITVAAPGEGR
jgi:hypothetical protein